MCKTIPDSLQVPVLEGENTVASWECYPRWWGVLSEERTEWPSSPASGDQGLIIKAGAQGPLDWGSPAESFCPYGPWSLSLSSRTWRDSNWDPTFRIAPQEEQSLLSQRRVCSLRLSPLRSRKTLKRELLAKSSWRNTDLNPGRKGSSSSCIPRTTCVKDALTVYLHRLLINLLTNWKDIMRKTTVNVTAYYVNYIFCYSFFSQNTNMILTEEACTDSCEDRLKNLSFPHSHVTPMVLIFFTCGLAIKMIKLQHTLRWLHCGF